MKFKSYSVSRYRNFKISKIQPTSHVKNRVKSLGANMTCNISHNALVFAFRKLVSNIQFNKSCLRDHSQTLVRGGLMQKLFIANIFGPPPPSDCKKFSGPPLFAMKLTGQLHRKHVNSIFNGKSVAIFFGAPLTRVKNFKGPPFCIRPPLQVFVNGPVSVLEYS